MPVRAVMVMVTLGVIVHGFTSESSILRQAADSTPASELALVTCGIESVVTTRAAPAALISAQALPENTAWNTTQNGGRVPAARSRSTAFNSFPPAHPPPPKA